MSDTSDRTVTPKGKPAPDPQPASPLICGPLLNFKRIDDDGPNKSWHGSVLVVVPFAFRETVLEVRGHGRVVAADSPALSDALLRPQQVRHSRTFKSERLYEDAGKVFWRFRIALPIFDMEMRWQYRVQGLFDWTIFCVPSRFQSMRIMFHSCNGFSIGTDMEQWKGPSLWNDVLRLHTLRPFHVMIGGGDQIYNDNVRTEGPLRDWCANRSRSARRKAPFTDALRIRCDEHYYENYVRWFTAPPFRNANSSIPQVNMWDDHDIIDGFGSYDDVLNKCDVFRGIGGVAHK
jgi:hypothetical protein